VQTRKEKKSNPTELLSLSTSFQSSITTTTTYAYNSSTSASYFSNTILRLSFSVGVNSPPWIEKSVSKILYLPMFCARDVARAFARFTPFSKYSLIFGHSFASATVFAALPISAIEDLTARVSVRKVPVGSAVVAQDEPGDAMFVIMSGRVKVVIFGESGREVTLSILRAGDSFGEMSLFDQAPRSAHCLAIEPTTLLVLSREDLMRHIGTHARTAMNLLGEMARRLRRADETIAQLALCDVNERLIHRLVGLAREEGASGPDGLVVRRRPTQQELAK